MQEVIIAAFEMLECEPGCSEEEVKSSYRQLVRVWHPDRFESALKLKQKATEKMKLINEAYQLLLKAVREQQAFAESDKENSESDKSAENDREQNRSHSHRAEFVIGSEIPSPHQRLNIKNGNIVYVKKVIVVKAFSGRVITQKDKTYRTKPTQGESGFEHAASASMSFTLKLEQGVKTPVIQTEGLPNHSYYKDRYTYSFPDGSSVEIGNSTTDIFWNHRLDWCNPRFELEEIAEDYEFFKQQKDWKQCVLFAQKAITLHPESSWGWIRRSYSLHCLSMTKDALWSLQNQALEKFKKETTIYYNLACYSAQLGQKQEAKDWLKSAFKLAAKEGCFERYRDMAMRDSDLTPIQGSISQIALLSKIARFF